MTRLLDGKVAIVTGGASGIGLATVERFIEEGARVTIADIQDDLGAAIAARFGDSAQFVRTDVTVEADIEAVVEKTVDAFGQLDVMFNNAGAQGDRSSVLEFDTEAFDQTISLLTRSVLLGHKYAARQFQRQGTGGSIISTTSAAGLQGGLSAPGYTAAKHAVVGVVKAAVAELGKFEIRSNAIAPGVIMTPILMKSLACSVSIRAGSWSSWPNDLIPRSRVEGLASRRMSQTSPCSWRATYLVTYPGQRFRWTAARPRSRRERLP